MSTYIHKINCKYQYLQMSTIYIDIYDEDTAKATALQCRLALRINLHDCSLDSKYS